MDVTHVSVLLCCSFSFKSQCKASRTVVCAHNDVEAVKSAIKEARSEVDRLRTNIYREAITLAESVGVTESCPRISSVQLQYPSR